MPEEMPDGKKTISEPKPPSFGKNRVKIKLEAYGVQMVEKEVRLCGTCGRIYLPRDWVGRRVKIIRID